MISIDSPPLLHIPVLYIYIILFTNTDRENRCRVGDYMLAKISIALYTIAAFLHYSNGRMTVFWLTALLGIATAVLSMYMSYRQVGPYLKEYREVVKQMEADGASDQEILEFMDRDPEIDGIELNEHPAWLVIFAWAGLAAGFALLLA